MIESKVFIDHLEIGESGWIHPGHLYSDDQEGLFVNVLAPFFTHPGSEYTLRVERIEGGFSLNRHHCRDIPPQSGTLADECGAAFDHTPPLEVEESS